MTTSIQFSEDSDRRARERAVGISEQVSAWADEIETQIRREVAVPGCEICQYLIDHPFGPSHRGSTSCESGSIASGGKESHCTCDVCF